LLYSGTSIAFSAKNIIYILLFFSSFSSLAQLEGTLQAGKIVQNYPRFPETSAAFISRIGWYKKLDKPDRWHGYYNFPELTIQATYGSLGNKRELGNILGLAGGFRFNRNISASIKTFAEAHLGIARFNRPFDERNNPDNVTIGSDFTVLATADAGISWQKSRLKVLLKASILHCSNSHYSLPNVGINLPMISAGAGYTLDHISAIDKKVFTVEKKPRLNFRLALGLNEQGGSTGPVNGPKYAVYLAQVYINRHYNPVARWTTGLEAYYNSGTYTFISSQRYYTRDQHLKSSSLLWMLGHEFLFGHVGLVTQGGLYIYNPFGRDRYEDLDDREIRDYLKTFFTGRLGMQYYLFNTFDRRKNNVFIGWYTKTNFGKADFLEFSAGYNF
jgi:hypothetical protein